MYDRGWELTRSSTFEDREMKKHHLKHKPVACLVCQMSLGDKGNWSHHQWNMLLIQSRFTCPVHAWSIMLLQHLLKSSLGPSVHYITHVWHMVSNSRWVSRSFSSDPRPRGSALPLDGWVFVLQLLLCLIRREVRADSGSAGCSGGMTDYSTSSAAPHHLLPNLFSRAILPAKVNQNQRRAAIIAALSSIVVQQRHDRLITLKYPSLECWQHPAWHINHI